MNVVVFGYGSMGQRHAQRAQAQGHTVTIHDPARGLGEFGEHAEVEAMRRAHAVIIATPARTHARLLWHALWLGARPVFVEKPLALNALQTAEMTAVFGSITRRVMVGYNLRHHAHCMAIKLALSTRKPSGAAFYVLCDGKTWPGREYADALLECSHEIDLALWMLGPAHVKSASSDQDGRDWTLVLQHDAGPSSFVRLSTRHDGYLRGAVISHRSGEISWRWDAPAGGASELRIDRAIRRETITPDDTYAAEIDLFLQHAAENGDADFSDVSNFTTATQVLRVCDAARELAAKRPETTRSTSDLHGRA